MNFNLGRGLHAGPRADLLRTGGRADCGAAWRHARRDRAERAAGGRSAPQRLSGRSRHDDPRSHSRPGQLGQRRLFRHDWHPAFARPRLHSRRYKWGAARGDRQRDHGRTVLAEPGRDRQALQVLRRCRLHNDHRRRQEQQHNGVAEAPIPFIYQPLPELYAAGHAARARRDPRGRARHRRPPRSAGDRPDAVTLQRPDAGRSGFDSWRRSARMSSSWPPSACWRWRSRRSASTASRATT